MNQYQQPPGEGVSQQDISLNWNKIPGLVGFSFIYFLLRILTLNIYYFWGKTETRRKLWNAVHLQGQPLQYTGRGMELFLGFLLVLFAFFMPFILILTGINIIFSNNPVIQAPVMIAIYIVFFYFIGVAVYKARNYQLTRTTWRGIRGSMHGSAWSFGWTYLWTTFVAALTLGWLVPWQANKLQRRLTVDTRFGDMPLSYDGSSGPLYGPYAFAWFSTILLVGALIFFYPSLIVLVQSSGIMNDLQNPESMILILYTIQIVGYAAVFLLITILSSWYVARTMNHFANSTAFDNARFEMKAGAPSLIWLTISNVLLVFLTLGIAIPIAQGRTLRYRIDRMSIDGSIDFNKVAQSQARLSATGEGLAEAFDLGAF